MKTILKRIGFASIFMVSALFLGGYYPDMSIKASNSASVDAFGRWRTSSPFTIFDTQNEYFSSALFWQDSTAAGGDTNWVYNGQPSVDLVDSAGANTFALRQTREYFRYQSGNSLLIVMTATPHVGKQGMRKLWGYGDASNGIFFRLQGDTLAVVKRSNATGSIIDSAVIQANWNVDKGNGTGPSGFNIKTYNSNVWWMDIAWLGVHRVRMGVITEDGNYVVLHQWNNANANVGAYMRTANLPLRAEARHYSGTAVVDTFTLICATVKSEAGTDNLAGNNFSAHRSYAGVSIPAGNSWTPVMTIRPARTLGGRTNRETIKDISFNALSISAPVQWALFWDAPLVSYSFNTFTADTLIGYNSQNKTPAPQIWQGVQWDTAGTFKGGAVTGGILVATGFIASGSGSGNSVIASSSAQSILSKLPLTNDIAGTTGRTLTLAFRAVGGTAATVYPSMSWREIY